MSDNLFVRTANGVMDWVNERAPALMPRRDSRPDNEFDAPQTEL